MARISAWAGLGLSMASTLVLFGACGNEDLGDDDNGGLVDAGSGGAAGADSGSGGSGAGSMALGKSCQSSPDCGADLECLTQFGSTADSLPGGLCTMRCDPQLSDADCAAVAEGALCVQLGGTAEEPEAYCFQGCAEGDPDACHGRKDVVCWDFGDAIAAAPACRPWCMSDEQCGGERCDAEFGSCTPSGDPGDKPIGAACNALASTDECADGFCIPTDEGSDAGWCTSLCRSDVFPQCGWVDPSSTEIPGVCLSAEDAGPADFGFCSATCNCNAECPADYVCRALESLEPAGKAGYCVFGGGASGGSPGIVDCNGGSGGAGGAGGAAGASGAGGAVVGGAGGAAG